MKNKITLFLLVLSSIGYCEWVLVYNETFSQDPGWITNSPSNYYWVKYYGSYYIKNIPMYPGYAVIPFAFKNNEFILKFDIRVFRCDFGGNVRIGFWDKDLSQRYNKGSYINVEFGHDTRGKIVMITVTDEKNITKRSQGMRYYTGSWYRMVLIYENQTFNLIAYATNNKKLFNLSLHDNFSFPRLDYFGTSILGYGGGFFNAVSIARIDNIAIWLKRHKFKLQIDEIKVFPKRKYLTIDFSIEKANISITNVLLHTHAHTFNASIKYLGENKYRSVFKDFDLLGNINATLIVYTKNENITTSVRFVSNISFHDFDKPLIVANDFYDLLYASVFDIPVITSHDFPFFHHIERKDVISLDNNLKGKNIWRTNREFLLQIFNCTKSIKITNNKTNDILLSVYASQHDMCLSNHGIDVKNEIDKIFPQEFDYIILTNPEYLLSALISKLVKKYNATIIFAKTKEEGKKKVRDMIYSMKFPKSFLFQPKVYLTLIGMEPFKVEDPWDEMIENVDGSEIYTDIYYADIDDDNLLDLYVGRIVSSLQFYDTYYKKRATILATYRSPKYIDLFIPGSMVEGFVAEHILRFLGFEVKRYVEHRYEGYIEDKKYVQEILTENVIEALSAYIPPLKWIEMGAQYKYKLLETDWIDKDLTKLPQLTENYYSDITFFFGKGNTTHWYLLNNTWKFMNYTYFLYDDHSMSGYSYKPSKLYIATTGIVHDPYALNFFFSFLIEFAKNKTIGEAFTDAKNTLVFLEKGNTSVKNLITSSMITKALRLSKKEWLTRLLFGDPKTKIDPLYYERNREFNYTIINNTIYYKNPDFYLLEYNKPIVPVYKYVFHLPTNARIKKINIIPLWKERQLSIPILKPDKYYEEKTFVGTFPLNNVWVEKDMLIDKRIDIIVWVAPVQYRSSGKSKYMEDVNISIEYEAPLDIKLKKIRTFMNFIQLILELKGEGCINITTSINNKIKETRECISGIKNITQYLIAPPGRHMLKIVAYDEKHRTPVITTSVNLTTFLGLIKKEGQFFKSLKTCCEYISFRDQINYLSSKYFALIKNNTITFISSDYKLLISQNSSSINYILITPQGIVKKKIENKRFYINIYGNAEESQLTHALSKLEDVRKRLITWLEYINKFFN